MANLDAPRRGSATAEGTYVLSAGTLGMFAFPGVAYATSNLSLTPVIVPFILVGAAFALAVTSVTAVTVNTVPDHALSHAYSVGYVIAGLAALVAAVLTFAAVRGTAHETLLNPQTLSE